MTLAEVLDRCKQQTRLTPLITDANLVSWLRQAIKKFGVKSKFLDKWMIIPCKADTAKYLLPGDHVITTAAFYDEVRLQQCTAFDAQLVNPTTPLYYYEDEWEDEASQSEPSEFAKHYALMGEFWMLQLMRSQNSYGRKTITLVAAPTEDGEAFMPITGAIEGTLTADSFYYPDTVGIPVGAWSSAKNILLFYKAFDRMPLEADDNIVWNDVLATCYTAGAVSLAMGTEDDEYDRYRAWLYDFIASGVGDALKGVAINARAR
jgi:hypothetical protein